MMTCREVAEFLGEYAEGTLDAGVRDLFDGHLRVCPACVAYLESYLTTIRLAQEAYRREPTADPGTPVPEHLVRAIMDARRTGH